MNFIAISNTTKLRFYCGSFGRMCIYCDVSDLSRQVVSDYRALLVGDDARYNATTDVGKPIIVTYSFPGQNNLPNLNDYNPRGADRYTPMSPQDRQNTRTALDQIEDVAGIRFVEVATTGTMQFFRADGADGLSWANYASDWRDWQTAASDPDITHVVINNRRGDLSPNAGQFDLLLHEIGHGLGLKHPFDGSVRLATNRDNGDFTVMSYDRGSHVNSLGPLDIDALQYLYGPAGGNDDLRIRWNEKKDVMAVSGTQGRDVIHAADASTKAQGWRGRDEINGHRFDDTLSGGHGNDKLLGYAGSDHLSGGKGRDRLEGGAGEDRLAGGPGRDVLVGDELFPDGQNFGFGTADTFIYRRGDGVDRILDFEPGIDKILFRGFGKTDIADAAKQRGDDLVFAFGSGDRLILNDTSLFELDLIV